MKQGDGHACGIPVGERRLAVLRDLILSAQAARSVKHVCESAAGALVTYPEDVPFALIYLMCEDRAAATLIAAAGRPAGFSADPPLLDLAPEGAPWTRALAGLDTLAVEVASAEPGGKRHALALPLLSTGQDPPLGLLLAGIEPTCVLDEHYRAFLDTAALQIGASIAAVRAAEHREREQGEFLDAERARALRMGHAAKLEAVGQLAGGVAHAFNNLLCTINGFAGLAMESAELPGSLEPTMTEIVDAGQRAAALTRRLLAYSRRQLLSPEPVDLNEIVERVEGLVQRLAGERIDVILDLEEDLALVSADARQLEQVVVELCENARDAMPAGGDLTLATGRLELAAPQPLTGFTLDAGVYAVLAVSDTGMGLAPGSREHLFEPFYTTKGMATSSGLGLATVYGIIKQSGGHIDVESTPGHGTTFRIYLPVLRRSNWHAWVAPLSASIGAKRRTILVAEDEEPIRKFVTAVLEPRGYTVLEAADGEEALALFEKHAESIDLVVTDVVMPRMGGRRLVEKLIERRPDLAVIFMSGYTEDLVFSGPRPDPCPGFLQKPFSPDALTQKVTAHLAPRS